MIILKKLIIELKWNSKVNSKIQTLKLRIERGFYILPCMLINGYNKYLEAINEYR